MKVVVFGGAGYLGGSLCGQLLDAGHHVTVFDNLSFGDAALHPLTDKPNFNFIKGDLRDITAVAEAVKGQEAAVLLASLVGEAACDKHPDTTVAINYLGSVNVAKSAAYYGLSRFIFTSTDSCYGAQENINLSEDDPLKPISIYAELKAKVEQELMSMDRPEGFHPTILRLATLYGLAPRMRFDLVINILSREAATGRGAKIFSGEQWRPLVHVKDAARAFVMALEADSDKVSGQVFNVGSNEQNVQFKDLAKILKEVMPDAPVETVPQPPDLRDYHVSFDKIRRVLNFTPNYTPQDGIREIKTAIESGRISDPYDSCYRNS